MTPELDIVIPVYNEGRNIVAVLGALKRAVATPARVLICYDHAEDDTLPAIRANPQAHAGLPLEFVYNARPGVHGAVEEDRQTLQRQRHAWPAGLLPPRRRGTARPGRGQAPAGQG